MILHFARRALRPVHAVARSESVGALGKGNKAIHVHLRRDWRPKPILLVCLSAAAAAVPIPSFAGQVTYYLTDPQGTPLAATDAAGNITSIVDHRPYGGNALGSDGSIGYTGHVSDEDTGLIYMQARYYDPEIGRLESVDPAQQRSGDLFRFSQFAYASNNPLSYQDPTGRDPEPTLPPTSPMPPVTLPEITATASVVSSFGSTTAFFVVEPAQVTPEPRLSPHNRMLAYEETEGRYLACEQGADSLNLDGEARAAYIAECKKVFAAGIKRAPGNVGTIFACNADFEKCAHEPPGYPIDRPADLKCVVNHIQCLKKEYQK